MAHFLRDENVKSLSVNEEALIQINNVFVSRQTAMPEVGDDVNDSPNSFLTYIIRFDNKGYRVFSIEELITRFHAAKKVERIIFTLESKEALSSSHRMGTCMELRLDCKEPNNCTVKATSDNSDWVDASFSSLIDVLFKYSNHNHYARSHWTQLSLQIFGVFLGFVVSVWASMKISPNLRIENAFLISFLLALMIFSNLWAYLNFRLYALVDFAFPNIRFRRPGTDDFHWLLQVIVGAPIGAFVLYLLNAMFTYIGLVLGGFISNGA